MRIPELVGQNNESLRQLVRGRSVAEEYKGYNKPPIVILNELIIDCGREGLQQVSQIIDSIAVSPDMNFLKNNLHHSDFAKLLLDLGGIHVAATVITMEEAQATGILNMNRWSLCLSRAFGNTIFRERYRTQRVNQEILRYDLNTLRSTVAEDLTYCAVFYGDTCRQVTDRLFTNIDNEVRRSMFDFVSIYKRLAEVTLRQDEEIDNSFVGFQVEGEGVLADANRVALKAWEKAYYTASWAADRCACPRCRERFNLTGRLFRLPVGSINN